MKAIVEFIFTNRYATLARYIQFALAVIIFAYAALMPAPGDLGLNLSDVVLHIGGNTLLVVSAWLAIYRQVRLYQVLLLIITYSFIIESAQGFTTKRSPELFDIACNSIGIAIGFVICVGLELYLRRFRLKNYHI